MKEERAKFFSAIQRKADTGLPALVVALCSKLKPPNVHIQIGCHVKGVELLSQFFECCFYHSVRNL